MAKENLETQDMLIPRAAARSEQFLGVIQKQTDEQGLDLSFTSTRRGRRDASVVLRSAVKVGRAADVELEVFAEPQGGALHVGWSAKEKVPDSWNGWARDMKKLKSFGASKDDTERKLRGILQAFNGLVFEPVVQMLVDAIEQEKGPSGNGFLGR